MVAGSYTWQPKSGKALGRISTSSHSLSGIRLDQCRSWRQSSGTPHRCSPPTGSCSPTHPLNGASGRFTYSRFRDRAVGGGYRYTAEFNQNGGGMVESCTILVWTLG